MLVIGGINKVFEIGKQFRNEGIIFCPMLQRVCETNLIFLCILLDVDRTHNTEFDL